jgi:anhydro-N-acetylmuramic acid kinase
MRAFVMLPFDAAVGEHVRGLLPPFQGSTAGVCAANVLVGEAFAGAAIAVAEAAGLSISEVDLIASHGQTVYHQVAPGEVRSTLQIGAPAVIAEHTGCSVVADFRPRDIAAGGQGAPLVPYLDALLFADGRLHRAVQNIGGIANVTYLPPGGVPAAFDTGPGNVLLDEAVRLLSDGRAGFDQDGRMAAQGSVDRELLDEWLAHPFFHRPPPKSTGREQWGPAEARRYVGQARDQGLSDADIVATLTAFTAWSIAAAYRAYCGRVDEVIVAGGGVRNLALLALLRDALPGTAVRPIDEFGLDADAKEAVAFALLGYAGLHGWPNNVPAATGAAHPVVLGSLTPGGNYRALLAQVLQAPEEPPRALRIVGAAQHV